MSTRIDKSWLVLESVENAEHDRCVDLFRRPDGSFGFEAFRRGSFGNAGHNLYVSRAGVLQRIHLFDLNQDGFPDLLFGNAHDAANADVPSQIYWGGPNGFAAYRRSDRTVVNVEPLER